MLDSRVVRQFGGWAGNPRPHDPPARRDPPEPLAQRPPPDSRKGSLGANHGGPGDKRAPNLAELGPDDLDARRRYTSRRDVAALADTPE